MNRSKVIALVSAFAAASIVGVAGAADVRGVTEDEIVIGTIQDLSGPLAALSEDALNGMLMGVDEINEAGGINGRKLDLVVADHGYQPQRALLATRRMIQRDQIFAMVGEMGSPTTMASMPVLLKSNVPSLFPLSGDTATYQPLDKLKWSTSVPYAAQVRAGIKYLIDNNQYGKICAIYQNDEFGTEVLRGAREGLSDIGRKLATEVSFQRGETNFTAGVSKLKSADCNLVVIGAALREPVAIMQTAHKLGWDPTFLGSAASYTRRLPQLAGDVANGFYAMALVQMPYTDKNASPELREWAQAYEEEYGDKPDVFSAYGYMLVDVFARAARDAGKDLTVDSLVSALEKLRIKDNLFGASLEFGPKQHMGASVMQLVQVVDGIWQPVTDSIKLSSTGEMKDTQ